MKNLNKKIGVVVLSGLVIAGSGLASSASAYNINNAKFLNQPNPVYKNLQNIDVLKQIGESNSLPFEILEINPKFKFFDHYYWFGPEKSFKSVEEFGKYYWDGNQSYGLKGKYLFGIGEDKVLLDIK